MIFHSQVCELHVGEWKNGQGNDQAEIRSLHLYIMIFLCVKPLKIKIKKCLYIFASVKVNFPCML